MDDIFKKDFIYLSERGEKDHKQWGEVEGEADSSWSREPDVELNLRTWGSQLELKVDAQTLNPGTPRVMFLDQSSYSLIFFSSVSSFLSSRETFFSSGNKK